MSFNHQDWKPVIIKKKIKKPNQKKTVVKKTSTGNKQTKYENKSKLDEDTGVYETKKVSVNLSRQIQQARTAKKLTQVELARKTNLPVSIIKNYESGKAIPNQVHISKIGRALGVQLSNKSKKKKEKKN